MTGDSDWHVGVVINSDYPDMTEVRPRKIAKKLDDDGHRCTILARKTQNNHKSVEYADISRLDWFNSFPLLSLISAPVPFNPFWVLWLALEFRARNINVVIGSDIRAGLPAIIAAKLTGIPVILDLQENNTARQARLPIESPTHLLTRNEFIIHHLELFCVNRADEVWVVVDERKHTLVDAGVSPKKISVVSNAPYLAETAVNQETNNWSEREIFEGLTLVYAGIITELRGLDLAIKSLPIIHEKDKSVNIVIAGSGSYEQTLRELAQRLDVQDSVHFIGRTDHSEVPAFLAAGDIGLLLNEDNRAHNTTIPNKIFEYMLAGIPVLATPLNPVSRVVNSGNCGFVLSDGDTPKDVAQGIMELKASPEFDKMGSRGQNEIKRRYNWTNEWETASKSLNRALATNENE